MGVDAAAAVGHSGLGCRSPPGRTTARLARADQPARGARKNRAQYGIMSSMDPVAIRRIVLEQSKRAHVGHVGSALSIADIVAALYGGGLRAEDPDAHHRDRGHRDLRRA